jgi:hypothetical protein
VDEVVTDHGPVDACPGCGGEVDHDIRAIEGGEGGRLPGYALTLACRECGARIEMDCLFAEHRTMYIAFHEAARRFADAAKATA